MFETVSAPAQAMLWLAIIEAAGFTAFTALAILPMVRLLKDYMESTTRIHNEQMNILIKQMETVARLVTLLEGATLPTDAGRSAPKRPETNKELADAK